MRISLLICRRESGRTTSLPSPARSKERLFHESLDDRLALGSQPSAPVL